MWYVVTTGLPAPLALESVRLISTGRVSWRWTTSTSLRSRSLTETTGSTPARTLLGLSLTTSTPPRENLFSSCAGTSAHHTVTLCPLRTSSLPICSTC